MKNIILLSLTILFLGCKEQSKKQMVKSEEHKETVKKKKRPVALENGKFFEVDGKKMLYGGENENQHFDVTDYLLKDEQFHYGIGREKFPAILKPEFISVIEADKVWPDIRKFGARSLIPRRKA